MELYELILLIEFSIGLGIVIWAEVTYKLMKRKEEKIMENYNHIPKSKAKRAKKEIKTKEVTRIVKLELTAIEAVAVDEPLRSKEEVLEVLKRKLRGMVDDVKILDMKTFEN